LGNLRAHHNQQNYLEIVKNVTTPRTVRHSGAQSDLRLPEAHAEDIVLIAGKGHETGQIVGDRVLPFDDVQVARECAA